MPESKSATLVNNNLLSLRGNKTQSKLASEIGLTKSHYGLIEIGSRIPSLPVALKIAEHFKCSLEDIFYLVK